MFHIYCAFFFFARRLCVYCCDGVAYVLAIWLFTKYLASNADHNLLVGLIFFLYTKGLSESAVMVIVVMAGFLLLDQIPYIEKVFPGPVQRTC